MRFRGLQSSEPKDFWISEVDEVQSPKMYETQGSGMLEAQGSEVYEIQGSGTMFRAFQDPEVYEICTLKARGLTRLRVQRFRDLTSGESRRGRVGSEATALCSGTSSCAKGSIGFTDIRVRVGQAGSSAVFRVEC